MIKVYLSKPKKVQHFNNKVTIVTLEGTIIDHGESFQIEHLSYASRGSFDALPYKIKVQGKAVCQDGDTFNSVLGERIAESRAKIILYTKVHKILWKIIKDTNKVLYGDDTIIPIEFSISKGLLAEDIKYKAFKQREQEHLKELIAQS